MSLFGPRGADVVCPRRTCVENAHDSASVSILAFMTSPGGWRGSTIIARIASRTLFPSISARDDDRGAMRAGERHRALRAREVVGGRLPVSLYTPLAGLTSDRR